MHALIFADRLGQELAPLTEKRSVPMLPLVGKELLIYTLEDVVSAGIREIVVIASAHGEQIGASTLGEGQRWGANIRYVLSRGEEAPSAVWSRTNLTDTVVALRGDVLRSPAVADLLARPDEKTSSFACYHQQDCRAGLLLLRPGCEHTGELLDILRWEDPAAIPPGAGSTVNGDYCNCLTDLPAFHRANLDLLAGRVPGLPVPGRNPALGLYAGRGARVLPKSLKKGVAYVGDNSRINEEAEFLGEVVIGRDVVVDRAATIRNSVILPNSYIGELVEVGNAVVDCGYLIRVDTGAVLQIDEAFLLGSLESVKSRRGSSIWDRLAGALLLTLSLPLWPIAAIAAALSGRSPLLVCQELVGNRTPRPGTTGPAESFRARYWNTNVPVLRNLPQLFSLISGHLRLVGVSPLAPEQSSARQEEWQLVRDKAPVGLIGPTQLNLPLGATLEERLLSDAFYAREQNWRKDLRYLMRGLTMLFNGEAWRRGG